MILTDSMLDAAYEFRMTEPWERLTDSNIFAVYLSDGTYVYCSIMGNGGEYHSLSIYIGTNGFSTYLRAALFHDMSMLENLNASIEFDCINCGFMQAKDIDGKVKKIVRNYAERKSIKIPRKNGWADFKRFSPFKTLWCITDEHDAFIAEEALKAATFFVKKFYEKSYLGVNLDPMGKYPDPIGGKRIPLIKNNKDGSYHLSVTTTPALRPFLYIAPIYENDILAIKLKKMVKGGDLECRLLHIPVPIADSKKPVPPVVGTLILADKNTSEMLMPITTIDYPDEPQRLLTQLAIYLSDGGICPQSIFVSDSKTYLLLKNFCKKCDIQLYSVDEMPDMDMMCISMIREMTQGM